MESRIGRPVLWGVGSLVLGVIAVAAVATWKAVADPGVAWLSRQGAAEWVRFPGPADTVARPAVALPAMFVGRFDVDVRSAPGAVLRLRAFQRAQVWLNGVAVPVRQGPDWKEVQEHPIAELLTGGANVLQIAVTHEAGPPAVWVEIVSGGKVLAASGPAWTASIAGSSWRSVVRASDPPLGRRYDPLGYSSPVAAAMAAIPGALLLALLTGASLVLAWRGMARRRPSLESSPAVTWVLLALIAGAWAVSLSKAGGDVLPLATGYDAREHLQYVEYLLTQRTIPLADQGWQMFQPPLYYLVVAAGWGLLGFDAGDPGALVVLRGIGGLIGVGHVALVALFLHRWFPSSSVPRLAGLLVVAFLPPMLCLHRFPTNEILGAALAGGVLLATLGLVRSPAPTFRHHVLVGVLLGAALLAKFSTLVLVPVVIAALALREFESKSEWRRGAGRILAVTASAAAVCGWHFGRTWWELGNPFVGGWESRPGLGWWSDPGYRTAEHFLRFGRVFVDPLFSGLGGFWDGLYSTLWGDGLMSGLAGAAAPPWWRPELHSAGLALAVVPCAAILLGLGVLTVRWIRRPTPELVLVIGTAALVLAALVVMTMRVPTYAQDKAFYGLLALAPLAVMVGTGVEKASKASPFAGAALLAGIAAWAAVSFATFDVDAASPEVLARSALVRMSRGDVEGALMRARAARAAAPEDWRIRVVTAGLLQQTGRGGGELDEALGGRSIEPRIAGRHRLLGLARANVGDTDEAVRWLRSAAALNPDDPVTLGFLARLLESAGDVSGAEQAWRDLLAVQPAGETAHGALARLCARAGRSDEARFHAGIEERILDYWRRRDEIERTVGGRRR